MLGTTFDTSAGIPAWARFYREVLGQAVPAWTPDEDAENYKRPMLSSWREFETTRIPDATFERWYGPGGQHVLRRNVGLITGAASGNIFVIDLDQSDGKDGIGIWYGLLAVHNHNSEIETPIQRTGGGGRQILLRWPEGSQPPTFKTSVGVDVRGEGGFAVLPPSLHASGREYAWLDGAEPWNVAVYTAPAWVVEWVNGLRGKYAARAGQPRERTDSTEDFTKYGLRVDGREDRMSRIIWGALCDLRREFPDFMPDFDRLLAERDRAWGVYLLETKTRIKDAASNEDGLEREGRGQTAFRRHWIKDLEQWDGKLKEEAGRPKPAPPSRPFEVEGDELKPWSQTKPTAFPTDCLPPVIRAFAEYEHASLGADLAGASMAALTVASGALDQRMRIRFRRSGNWYEPVRLWTVLVGSPSYKKTPTIADAERPLRRVEKKHADQHARDVAVWKEQGSDKGSEPPPTTHLIINNTTTEAMAEILSRQPRGALVVADELSGFVGSLDRYANSGGGDSAFWLSLFSAKRQTFFRVGGNRDVDTTVAFLSGIQPDRCRELADLMVDGLMQRFLPVMLDRGGRGGEVESDMPALLYGDAIEFLSHMKPQTFVMNDAALVAAEAVINELKDIEEVAGQLSPHFEGWVGKLQGYFLSLALLLHILENIREAELMQISEDTVERARRIITEFIIPHGRVFYQQVLGHDGGELTKTIASFLLTSKKDRFMLSDFRSVPGLKSTARGRVQDWEIRAELAPFISGGWLDEDGDKGRAWTIKPNIREQYADQRESERERKAKYNNRFKDKDEQARPGDQL